MRTQKIDLGNGIYFETIRGRSNLTWNGLTLFADYVGGQFLAGKLFWLKKDGHYDIFDLESRKMLLTRLESLPTGTKAEVERQIELLLVEQGKNSPS